MIGRHYVDGIIKYISWMKILAFCQDISFCSGNTVAANRLISHNLNQCGPSYLTPYGVTGPQWVQIIMNRFWWGLSGPVGIIRFSRISQTNGSSRANETKYSNGVFILPLATELWHIWFCQRHKIICLFHATLITQAEHGQLRHVWFVRHKTTQSCNQNYIKRTQSSNAYRIRSDTRLHNHTTTQPWLHTQNTNNNTKQQKDEN